MSVTILYDHCILYMSRVRAFMCDKVVLHRGNCTRVSVSVFDRPLTPSLKSRCDHKWVIWRLHNLSEIWIEMHQVSFKVH